MGFVTKPVTLGTGDTEIFECPATYEGAVVLLLSNIANAGRTYTVKFYKQSTGATTSLAVDTAIAANTPTKFPVPLSMMAGDKIIASASAGSSIVAFPTITLGGSSARVGFNPQGVWSSGATYAKNDIVSLANGNSYVALQASTNQNPSSATAYWMVLAAKGDAGAGDFSGPGSSVGDNLVAFNGTGGKTGKDSGIALANVALKSGANAFTGANTYTKTQKAVAAALTSASAPDFSTYQRWTANVNGGTFTIANPTSPVDGTFYSIMVTFTTSHSLAFGNKFKTAAYSPTAASGKKDHLLFYYDSTADQYWLVGMAQDITA